MRALLLLSLLLLLPAGSRALAAGSPLPELCTAQEVRDLSAAEAERHYPVRLQGVLTFFDQRTPGRAFRFLQDETAGIYIYPPADANGATAGQRAEIEGHSGQCFVANQPGRGNGFPNPDGR
jgi:hypothetical protein